MAISKEIVDAVKDSSLIRKMFEEGLKRIKLYGADKVFDLSIGNPVFEPPEALKNALISVAQSEEKGKHRYMSNAGFPATRDFIAEKLSSESKLIFETADIIMTTGASSALNVIFRTLLNRGDEVVAFKPYFIDYKRYVQNHGGSTILVDTDSQFRPRFELLEQAINPKVKAVLINSPNNPTGVVYNEAELNRLGQLLLDKSKEYGHPISLVSDEPYKKIAYDTKVPSVFNAYAHSIVATSFSKDLAVPGERIGYIAISPRHEDRKTIQEGAVIALRILGFINAPAIWQKVIPLVGDAMVDMKPYQTNRDILYNHLTECGFKCVKPEGGFYLFPQSPIEDDMEFIIRAQEFNLLMVPGVAFGTKGFFRISYCFDTDMIQRSLPLFSELAKQYKLT